MANAIPYTQRAWTVTHRGTPQEALELKTDWPVPSELKAGEVLVKVQAAALNPVGYKLMKIFPNPLVRQPHVAEHDFSGVVVDANGSAFTNGDFVFGWVDMVLQLKTNEGALAEYLSVPAENIVLRPKNTTPTEAAGVALTSLTAYRALFEIGELEAEQTVLINGGSSAVGSYAIQFAKAKGAKVVATASGGKEQFVRDLGADEVIDYTKSPLVKVLTENPPSPKYQVILEAVGLIDPSLFTHSESYLAPTGIFVSTGPQLKTFSLSQIWAGIKTLFAVSWPSWLGGVNRRWTQLVVKNNPEHLKEIQKMLENGSVKPPVDSVYSFDDVLKAYEHIMTSKSTGKVVVKLDPTIE